MTLENILEVEKELDRFKQRLEAAKTRIETDPYFRRYSGTKETGALKRSAMDLKNELTKLTK